ncbi:MAG: transglutaminase [Puniceicoccaceae bacterium]|nr:MAG: transglutaminase [Puniceicoccaceae bacterium]
MEQPLLPGLPTDPVSVPGLAALAGKVEAWLDRREISLTMGGEPTFVPLQPEGEEWSTAAMGPEKLGYARRFGARLIEAVYPGALAMQVFGKWYPAEALPRWNLLILWQKDGQPLWRETNRLHLDHGKEHNTVETAAVFSRRLAAGLGLEEFLLPAYEQDADGETVAGWVLPLQAVGDEWVSEQWSFPEDERLELFLGDSPVGLRLPLYKLPEDALRCALTVETEEGSLAVFIPPLPWEAFKRLIVRIEELVRSERISGLVFCGYGPSEAGEAVVSYALAADPGVLEVNLPPCRTWADYRTSLDAAYRAAGEVGLRAIKFHLNGAVHGTGGGAHLAFGGATLERSPFLEEPSRIASVLRYWQHHPVLSYAFTGLYVGPGCQAPRVDEGPLHGLYELEVACEGLENLGKNPDGPLLDQFLRNLLTDSAGNTHRAELCFDKFHNPITPNGRLGIVELRAFEALPHPEWMGRVALFIRAVLVRLFRKPFRRRLRRFGPGLHDHYFLPAWLWQDLETVCADLDKAGFSYDPEWLRPVFEFRFPVLGRLDLGGGELEVRQAPESWPLMAEESRGATTVRVVDNSSDRLQLMISNPDLLETGKLLVNGVEIPFHRVGDACIAGLRYKCASAYPALHPHVSIQSPLLFEWVHGQRHTITAAGAYHFWNPHGPVYDGRPADADEARRRRSERWQLLPGIIGLEREGRKPRTAPEFSATIDLRRQGA